LTEGSSLPENPVTQPPEASRRASSGLSGLWARIYSISLYRNAVYLMLNSVVGAATGFAFWVLAARLYPTAEVGLLSAIIAAMSLINTFSLFGFNVGLTRFLPEEADKRAMANTAFTAVAVSSTVLSAVFIAGTPFWSPALSFLRDTPSAFTLFAALTIAFSLLTLQAPVFVALRAAKFTFVQQTVVQTLKLVLIAAFIPLGAMGAFSAWGLAGLGGLLLGNLWLMRKTIPGYWPRPPRDRRALGTLFRYSLWNYVAEAVNGLPVRILPILVVNMLGPDPSAFFRIGYGVVSILLMIPYAAISALFAEGSSEPAKLTRSVRRAVVLMAITVAPAVLILWFLGDKILLLFGQSYSDNTVNMLRIMSLSVFPVAVVEVFVVVRRVELRLRPVILVYVLESALIIGAAVALMPALGISGAGYGWLLGYALTAVAVLVPLVRWYRAERRKSMSSRESE